MRVKICAQDLERLCVIDFWLLCPTLQNCAPFVNSHGYGPTDTNQGPNNLCQPISLPDVYLLRPAPMEHVN